MLSFCDSLKPCVMLCSLQVWAPVCVVHGAHGDLGHAAEGDPGEDASPVEAGGLHPGRKGSPRMH